MSKINYQALREAAEATKIADTPLKLLAFHMKVTPQVVQALLDELETKEEQRANLQGTEAVYYAHLKLPTISSV